MTRPFSIYLDLVRFTAAILVVLSHASQDGIYRYSFWLDQFGHEAVVIFFVLSGFVIYSTSARPTETMQSYGAARFSRLYSVVLPAIALSYLLKGSIAIYTGGNLREEFLGQDLSWITLASVALFLTESWNIFVELPWNGPFWSLSYEAWYYVIFGLAYFQRGHTRYILVLLACLIAGPRILALFPIWMIGVGLAKWRHQIDISPHLGASLLFLSTAAVGIVSSSGVDVQIQQNMTSFDIGWWRLGSSQRLLTDYLLGLFVLANFVGFSALEEKVAKAFLIVEAPIRFLAGYTFSIYLFHRPLMQSIHSLKILPTDISFSYSCMVTAACVAICMLLGQFTEKRRDSFRTAFNSGANMLASLLEYFRRESSKP